MPGGLDGESDGDQEIVVPVARVDVVAEALVGLDGGAGQARLLPELGEECLVGGALTPVRSQGERE
jgi:hypothetical protein